MGQVPGVPMLNTPGTGLFWKKPQDGASLAQLWLMTGTLRVPARAALPTFPTTSPATDTVTALGESLSPVPPTALIHGLLGTGSVGKISLP